MPLNDLILWQNVPTGATVDIAVEPAGEPILADGVHTLGGTTLDEAGDAELRPGPRGFERFGQPGNHTVDVRVANQGARPVEAGVTATLRDRDGNVLAGPTAKSQHIPVGDFYLVMILVKVVGGAALAPVPGGVSSPMITVHQPTSPVAPKPARAKGKKKKKKGGK